MTDFTPHYHRIEQALRALVARSAPHDPLPSEPELAREHGVSRMTARAAVTNLVSAGLAYRSPGRGTFVAVPAAPRRADNLVRFSEEMRRQGRTPSSLVVDASVRPATEAETARLRLPTGVDVVAVSRVRLADGTPVAVERAVFPGALAAVLEADLAGGSLHAAVTALGRTPTRGTATLTAAAATRTDARLLSVRAGAPLLVERRLILDAADVPLELTESRYAGERYHLDVAFGVGAAENVGGSG
ncbi:GntR family transcriptional regulator [Dactylosporangium aurantiacum]|uniref:GntR family transcriptional regulator n=1 Tax=Dactylosporangium aurantiacum TaxID=35754 RepID=A0A9Q9INP0_9ACTN|nr:GntR family transcriptional regulator [Dactylosporangium aurantiacum]MDG6108579.1 GntR family transcriptional regulator [Dactylosporangium aurantiacum]UWZ57245.1 GntR family transcriptional regulator [Dactylosporangium aurantiacum]